MSFLTPTAAKWIVDAAYILVAFLFITGLKRMSSPVTARGGIFWAGLGMVIATLVTFLAPSMTPGGTEHAATNLALVIVAIRARRCARLVVRPARRDDRHAADDRALQRHGRRRGGGDRRGRAVQGRCARPGVHDAGHTRRPDRLGIVLGLVDRVRQAAGPDQALFPLQRPAVAQRADPRRRDRARWHGRHRRQREPDDRDLVLRGRAAARADDDAADRWRRHARRHFSI